MEKVVLKSCNEDFGLIEVIINERSTVSYCRYLVNKFKKFYPQEKNLHKHLDNNLKTLSDKNEMEENEIMSQFLKFFEMNKNTFY